MLNRNARYLLLAVTTLGITPWFQAQAPSGPQIPPPTIRISTRLVLLDVVVTDKQGNAVTGLQADDFQVDENGKAQKISTFSAQDEINSVAPPLPPGIYSNRAQYRLPGGPITVMLLDGLNTPFKDQAYARRQMLRFVQEQYKPGQRLGIFTLTGSLNVLQDFTTDPDILQAALERYKPVPQQFASSAQPQTSLSASGATAASTVTALDASAMPATSGVGVGAELRSNASSDAAIAVQSALRAFEGAQVAYAEEQRAVLTLQALNSLGRILGGLPGRKSIIWVTGNLPFTLIPEDRNVSNAELEDMPTRDQHTLAQHVAANYAATFRESHAGEIRETAARLASAQIALYPVDAGGLSLVTSVDSQDTMREVARETGGRAYVNENEIRSGVARAFADQAATYILGYYPDNKKWDGKYRQIKVKVKRDGVQVQARRGYYALDPTQIKGYSRDAEAASALKDVVPSTVVAFSARVRPPSTNSAPGKVGVDFLVDASTLSTEDADKGKKVNAAFYAMIVSPDGKILASRSQKVDQAFNADIYQQILQKGLLLHMDMDPVQGKNQLHLAVQDNRTGMVGTINAPLVQ